MDMQLQTLVIGRIWRQVVVLAPEEQLAEADALVQELWSRGIPAKRGVDKLTRMTDLIIVWRGSMAKVRSSICALANPKALIYEMGG